MLTSRGSYTRLWMGFLVHLVYISSVISVPIRSAENGRTTHQIETGSLATILESKQRYHPNLSNTLDKRNSSPFCTHGFFDSRPSKADNHPSITSIFFGNQHRIKRCLPEYRARLKSERLKARSKFQRVDESKNDRFARPSKVGAFPKSATESQRLNEGQPLTDEKRTFENTTKAILSDLTSSNNSTKESSNSSSTSNQTEKYLNESFLGRRNNIKETEKRLEPYPKTFDTNLEGSTKQTGSIVSNQTTSSENLVPFESKTIESETPSTLYAASDFSNLLTDPSTSPMDTGNFRKINQNYSTSTEQPTEGSSLILNFEESHNPTTPIPESNSPRPDSDFLNVYQNIPKIFDSRNTLTPNNTFVSKREWWPQITQLQSSSASCESRTDPDVFSTPISQIPPEPVMPKVSGGEQNSFDLNTNGIVEENTRFRNDSISGNHWFTASPSFSNENQTQQSITPTAWAPSEIKEKSNKEEISTINPTGSLTFPTNNVTQSQNMFTVDPTGSEERENSLDFQTHHPGLSKLENMSENISGNTNSTEYHHKNDHKYSRNHKNISINVENEALPYPSFLRTYLHQPPESTITESNLLSLFESDTTNSSESNNPKTYQPSNETKVESFTTSDLRLNHDSLIPFTFPANSTEVSTNKNCSAMTPATESLEATEANVIHESMNESINEEKSSFNLQLIETSTEKLEDIQNSSDKFEIVNKINERFDSTAQQTEEYGSILAELLEKENERNSSLEIDARQNLSGTVQRNRPNQTGNSENSVEVIIQQPAISENTLKIGQMKNVELEATEKMADQTETYQTRFLSAYSLPQTNPTYTTNYGSLPEMQVSDSLSTRSNFFSTTTTKPQPETTLFTRAHADSSKTENSSSTLTVNCFTREMENLSEGHSRVLVKKSLKHLPRLPVHEYSLFSTPTIGTDPAKYTSKKYKLKHFSGSSSENLFQRNRLESINSISKDQKSSHISAISPADSRREHSHPPESLSTDSTLEFDFKNNWTSSTDSENKTITPEHFQPKDVPSNILFQNNSDSYPQNLVNLKAMRKTHKIQPGEVVPPMNPNENWKIGENDTYYTVEELRSFFKMKKRLAAGKGKYSADILIDFNGLNETTVIDFLKHNLTSAQQNETIPLDTTKYITFRLFSNSSDDSNGVKNELSNSTLIYSLIPEEDVHRRVNSSKNVSATQKLETLKYLTLFNTTEKDENALKFFQQLSSLNETYLGPNLDFNENDFNATRSNKNASNGTGHEKDKSRKTEVILVHLKDPQPEKLLEKISDCKKIVVIAENEANLMKSVKNVDKKKNYAEEFAIYDQKNLLKGESVDVEQTHISDRKNAMEGKSVVTGNNANEILSRHHSVLPLSSHRLKAKPRDPQEQLIREQFNFVDPQIVDNFLDVYKHYSPRHSASRSKMGPQNCGNARNNEDMDWTPEPRHSYSNKPPNFMDNLLRELVRLKNSVPAAYISHGYEN